MRHILTSVFLVVFLFPSLALGVEIDDLVERAGLFYEKFTDVPFTGEVTGERVIRQDTEHLWNDERNETPI